jgi:RNA polymerase sigma-70 factor (ECF subfamily)
MALSTGYNEPDSMTDEQLVGVIQAGEPGAVTRAAAEELFSRYRRRVYAFALRYLRSHDLALDASQDILLAAFEKLDTFGGRSDFSSWLFAIARNRCLNVLQSTRSWKKDEAALENITDGSILPDRRIEEQEDKDRLFALMRRTLEPLERKALSLRCFEKVSVDEITRLLKIESASGARGILQKARRKLRAALEGA